MLRGARAARRRCGHARAVHGVASKCLDHAVRGGPRADHARAGSTGGGGLHIDGLAGVLAPAPALLVDGGADHGDRPATRLLAEPVGPGAGHRTFHQSRARRARHRESVLSPTHQGGADPGPRTRLLPLSRRHRREPAPGVGGARVLRPGSRRCRPLRSADAHQPGEVLRGTSPHRVGQSQGSWPVLRARRLLAGATGGYGPPGRARSPAGRISRRTEDLVGQHRAKAHSSGRWRASTG